MSNERLKTANKTEISDAQQVEKLGFEEGIEQLEQIVRELEQKDVSLETALNLFRRGIEIVQHCNKLLDNAERQMEILLEGPGGELRLEPANVSVEG